MRPHNMVFRRSILASIGSLLACCAFATAQPANDACNSAQVVTAGLPAATGTNAGASMDGPVPSCVNNNFGGDVWYRYISTPNSGPVTIDTCGSNFDTILTVFLGFCPTTNSNQVACDDDGAPCGPEPFRQSRVVVTPSAAGGDVFLIRVHGFGGNTGNVVLNVNPCRPQILSTSGGGEFCNLGFVQLSVTATGTGNTFQWFQDNSPLPDTNTPSINVPNFTATYFCRVTNSCGTVDSAPIVVTRTLPPSGLLGPFNTTICEGDSGSISVSVQGDALEYRWETEAGIGLVDGSLFNGTIVSGTHTPTLTFSNPQFADSQGFRCRAFNNCGSLTTPSAHVALTGQRELVPSIHATIQAAIDAISSGSCGSVLVEPGTYFEHLNFGNRRIRLLATGGPLGNQGPEDTIIDGGGTPGSVIQISASDNNRGRCVIEGFTIRNGRGTAGVGGGVLATFNLGVPGPTRISRCIIENNQAGSGGGIYSVGEDGLALDRVIVRNNSASGIRGGGVTNFLGPITADRCIFENNSAPTNNSSAGGGVATENTNADSRFTNCLFSGNSSHNGGGLFAGSAVARVVNCTFVGNAAPNGSALYSDTTTTDVSNTIVWANLGANHLLTGNDGVFRFTFSNTQSQVQPGIGNISADPLFASETNFRLRPGSPCIDAGDAAAINGSVDLDGLPRRIDDPAAPDTGSGGAPLPDMGVFERNPAPSNTCATAPTLNEGTYAFSTEGASTDGFPEPSLCNNANDNNIGSDVWIRYLPSCTGSATLTTCGSNYDTKLGVYRTDGCPSQPGTIAACNDDSSACGFSSVLSGVTLSVTAGEPLLVRLGGYLGAVGNATLNISCTPSCSADFNSDGDVNGDDLADYINCFFGVPPCDGADFNRDMDVNGDDLADYINVFFGGC